jgi:DNA protecting protein DprA
MKYQDEDNFGLHLLALGRIRGIGIHILRAFINRYGSLSQVWDTDAASLLKVLTDAKAKDAQVLVKVLLNGRARHLDGAAKELATLREKGVCILSARSDEFPERLRNTPSAPYWLFVQGAVSALKAPLVGIVGTRTPSQEGIHTAVGLAAIVAEEGFGIVSGLAEGIDHVAHRMGIYYRVPQVAVLGTGIEIVFPSGTARTRTQIIETGGAIVTEYLPQDSYNKARFVERDRIQAGLALALVPVESRAQSGTAHTLRFAEKYHRPIFGAQRGTPSPENELLFILRERGYPIFDIGVEEQVGRLVQWLRGKIADSEWPTHRYQLDREWLFRAVLQPLEDISKFVPLTDTHVRWLQERIARSAGLDTSGLRVDQPVNVMQDNRQVGDHETIAASETEAVGADSVDRAGWAAPSFASTAAQIEAETVAQAAQTKARKKRKDKSRSEKQASQPRQEREEGNSVESGGVTSADMAAEAAPTMERQAGLPLEDIPTNDGS